MNWLTIYISGRPGFQDDVRKKLESSEVDFMPGYLASVPGKKGYDLYWLNETVDLKTFKKAIGSKLIWKYRLRFYTTLEEFLESQSPKAGRTAVTKDDRALFDAMRNL